ncbi:MAG: tetratricopeptide repeat protein [Candidatus Helarchaeota archaeon]
MSKKTRKPRKTPKKTTNTKKDNETNGINKADMAKKLYDQASELRKNGKYADAIPIYQKSLNLSPNNPSTLNDMAWTYYLMGEYEDAIRYAEIALDIAPTKGFIWDTLACAYFQLGDIDKSWQCFEQMKRVDPTEKGTVEIYQRVKKLIQPKRAFFSHKGRKGSIKEQTARVLEPFSNNTKAILAIIIIASGILLIHNVILGIYLLQTFLAIIL